MNLKPNREVRGTGGGGVRGRFGKIEQSYTIHTVRIKFTESIRRDSSPARQGFKLSLCD